MNIVLAIVILFGIYAFNGVPEADPIRPRWGRVNESPASERLAPGDQIVAVDGVTGDLRRSARR